ncbi:MAG: winged helix-turn-helix domain-containing protein [Pyrinomonadaceae bacterium]
MLVDSSKQAYNLRTGKRKPKRVLKTFGKPEFFLKNLFSVINRPSKRYYEFDSFRIDIDERRLICGVDPIPLAPKVFDVLLALVENNRHTIHKDELIDRVWADTFVEDGNLNRNISTLRKVLGEDSHKPHYIRTVPKRGYRFEADVREIIEEDEELRIERVTNYHVAIRQDIEKRTSERAWTRFFSVRGLTLTAPAVLVLILVSAWAITREPTQATNAVSAIENSEAYELYRQGRAQWQDRSVGGLHNATVLLEQAVIRDPNFALAHAALADAYAFDGRLWKRAENTAGEAITLDPNLGEPHATMGFVRTFWDWKPAEAEDHFKRAVVLSPDYATAHQWFALSLAIRAQFGAAVAEMQRAVDLEPGSAAINTDMCRLLYFARKFDAAIDRCNRAIEIDPNFLSAYENLYEVYTAKAMYAEAIDAYFAASKLNLTAPVDPSLASALRQTYDVGGVKSFWRSRIDMLKKPAQTGGYALAKYHARLGENDRAIRWLEKAAETRDFEFIFVVADPVFENLTADDRFIKLRAQFVN